MLGRRIRLQEEPWPRRGLMRLSWPSTRGGNLQQIRFAGPLDWGLAFVGSLVSLLAVLVRVATLSFVHWDIDVRYHEWAVRVLRKGGE